MHELRGGKTNMKFEELRALPLFQTSSIAAAAEDPETLEYIIECLGRFYSGDFGEVPADDTAANLADLEAGGGHVLARYKAAGQLADDVYINAVIDDHAPDVVDANNIMVMYCNEH